MDGAPDMDGGPQDLKQTACIKTLRWDASPAQGFLRLLQALRFLR